MKEHYVKNDDIIDAIMETEYSLNNWRKSC